MDLVFTFHKGTKQSCFNDISQSSNDIACQTVGNLFLRLTACPKGGSVGTVSHAHDVLYLQLQRSKVVAFRHKSQDFTRCSSLESCTTLHSTKKLPEQASGSYTIGIALSFQVCNLNVGWEIHNVSFLTCFG